MANNLHGLMVELVGGIHDGTMIEGKDDLFEIINGELYLFSGFQKPRLVLGRMTVTFESENLINKEISVKQRSEERRRVTIWALLNEEPMEYLRRGKWYEVPLLPAREIMDIPAKRIRVYLYRISKGSYESSLKE